MKSLHFVCLILLACCCSEYVNGEAFVIPIEVATPELGSSVVDLYQKCEAINKCTVARVQQVIDVAEQISGERMIHRIVERAHNNYSISETEWDAMIDEECRSNAFLHELPNTGLTNLLPCMPGFSNTTPAFHSVIQSYINEYCDRVSKASKQMLLMFEF